MHAITLRFESRFSYFGKQYSCNFGPSAWHGLTPAALLARSGGDLPWQIHFRALCLHIVIVQWIKGILYVMITDVTRV